MKLVRLALIACLSTSGAMAQNFESLNNKRGENAFLWNDFEVMIRRTQVSGKYTESFGGTTFNFKWRSETYQKGGMRWHFENSTLGDMMFVLARLLKGDDVTVRSTEQSFGGGFLGWHQVYGNVIATDKVLLSAGASFGDYIFGSKRLAGTSDPQTLEPNGYYLHLGPAIMATTVVGNSMWVDGYLHYDIGFKVTHPGGAYQDVKGYPRPGFLNAGANVHHAATRLFGGLRVNHMIDRGSSNDAATRLDVSFGYMFGRQK